MIGRTLGVGAAGHVTFDVAAEDVRERTPGKKFNYARDGMLQAGVPPWQVDLVMELHAVNKQNRWNAVTSDIEKVTGTPPTDFAQFARDHADKFRAN